MDTGRNASAGGSNGAGAVAVALALDSTVAATDGANAAATAAHPPPAPTPTLFGNVVDRKPCDAGAAAGGTGGEWNEGEQGATAAARAKPKAEKKRRASIMITRGGQTVATIKGGVDSWEMVEAKAMEHYRGTREWVFRAVYDFVDLAEAGECAGRAML